MAKIQQESLPNYLNKYDIYFLSRRLNLSKSNTILLTEIEQDLNLLLYQICRLPLTKKQTKNLSDIFLIKLLIFKYGRKKKLKTKDLIQLSKIVCDSYNKIVTGDIYLKNINKNEPNLEHSSTVLVMFGLFSDYFSDYTKDEEITLVFRKNLDFIVEGLEGVEFSDPCKVLNTGLDILNEIKEKEWLKETKMEL